MRHWQVETWLALKREREMTIGQSVRVWLGHDALGRPNRLPTPEQVRHNEESMKLLTVSPRRRRMAGGTKANATKQSISFDLGLLDEMRNEAHRQGRSISWMAQRAWTFARDHIRGYPTSTA